MILELPFPPNVNAELLRRFYTKLIKNNISGCWEWRAAKNPNGYGLFRGPRGPLAHRVSYAVHRGEIPGDLCVLHRCDVRCCVNPAHLFLGTQLENIQDRDEKKRGNGGCRMNIGEANGGAKLSEQDVVSIRSSRDSRAELSSKFGVSKTAITRIRSREYWVHL